MRLSQQEIESREMLVTGEAFLVTLADVQAVRDRALKAQADRLRAFEDRYRWRPISEIHEDYGDVVLVNIADPGYLKIGSNLDLDWDESKWTHFTRFAPIGQHEYERMAAEAKAEQKRKQKDAGE